MIRMHMNKSFWAMAAFAAVALYACNPVSDDSDIPDSPEEYHLTANSEIVSVPAAILGVVDDDLSNALKTRFPVLTTAVTDDTGIIMVPWAVFQQQSDVVLKAYAEGKVIAVIAPDNAELNKWMKAHDIHAQSYVENDRNLIEAFTVSGWRYDLDNPLDDSPAASANLNAYLNPFVRWVNDAISTPSVQLEGFGGDGMVNVATTFDHACYDKTYHIYLKKELGHVALSTPDVVEASSSATLHLEYYPLYSFEDNNSNGDYYLFSAKFTIENRPMYKGSWVNKHGGVKTHLCAFIFDYAKLNFQLMDSDYSEITPKFDVGPNPETTSVNVSHEEGMSWSLDGSVTGGWEGSGPAALLSVSGGVSFSNSTSVSFPDLLVRNNSSKGQVKIEYDIADEVAGYMRGGTMYPPTATLCKSDLVLRASWVWRIDSTKDNSDEYFTLMMTPEVGYSAMRFYSTALVDGKFYYFDNAITNRAPAINIQAPNRVPTGQVKINNTESQGIYFTDMKIWKANAYRTGSPVYSNTESVASGDSKSVILPTGDYRADIRVGRSSTSLRTCSTKSFTVRKGDVLILNSAFDFN